MKNILKNITVIGFLFSILIVHAKAQVSSDGLGWIVPGTQLTYYCLTGNLSDGNSIVPNDDITAMNNGSSLWKDNTCSDYTLDNNKGAECFLDATVSHIDNFKACISVKNYGVNSANNQIMAPQSMGIQTQRVKAENYWISPRVLEKMTNKNSKDLFVQRLNYNLSGHVYHAVLVRSYNDTGYTNYIYDLASGVVLHMSQLTQNPNSIWIRNDSSGTNRSRYQLIETWFKGYRKIGMPWAGQMPPTWVSKTHQLNYQGFQSTVIPGAPVVNIPSSIRVNFNNLNAAYSVVSISANSNNNFGSPVMDNSNVVATSEYGSFWIPSKFLVQMQQNQVLDINPITQNRIYVIGVQNQQVGIAEVGSGFENRWYYSLSDGILTGFESISRFGNATVNMHQELVNRN